MPTAVDYLAGYNPALAAACDIALAFTTSGAANWFSQTAESYYDNDAVQSGDIGDDQETVLEATVSGTGTLTFWWKTSTQVGDEAAFYIDGAYKTGRSGISGWNQVSQTITTTGTHTLRWEYMKDSSGSSGSDCIWVDYVQWTGTMPSLGSWSTIVYTYDPAGRRIEKKVDGTTQVKYVYDGDHILAEYNNAGTLLRKYVHGPCTDEPICMIEACGTYAGTFYYHFDALGSVVGLTNSGGNMVELYEYSVYGQVAASDENHPNRFMFTGREFDKDTGLYYYRARYYNPEIGRFLQTDPIGYGDGMNMYRYCRNSPVISCDPSGQWTEAIQQAVDAAKAVKALVDYPVVVIGMQRGSEVVVHAYQIQSREDLYRMLFLYNVFDDNWGQRSIYDQIVYLDIQGHGFVDAKGQLMIGRGDSGEALTGRLGEDTTFESSTLLAREHKMFMRELGLNPSMLPFETLVKSTFASNAVIYCNFCYSAQGAQESVAHAWKELLPHATVYGWTGSMWGLPTNDDWTEWMVGPWPWPPWPWNSKLVEVTL